MVVLNILIYFLKCSLPRGAVFRINPKKFQFNIEVGEMAVGISCDTSGTTAGFRCIARPRNAYAHRYSLAMFFVRQAATALGGPAVWFDAGQPGGISDGFTNISRSPRSM